MRNNAQEDVPVATVAGDGIDLSGGDASAAESPIPQIKIEPEDVEEEHPAELPVVALDDPYEQFLLECQDVEFGDEEGELVTLLPMRFTGQVIYDPNATGFAAYDCMNNAMLVSSKGVRQSEALLRASLRHEYSHYILWNLSEDEQRTIVNLFIDHHQYELQRFYSTARSRGYPQNRFDPLKTKMFRDAVDWYKRGYRVDERIVLMEADGSMVEVDALAVIDELLAFAAAVGSGKRVVIGYEEFRPTFVVANDIVLNLHPELRKILERNCFFDLREDALLDDLHRNLVTLTD